MKLRRYGAVAAAATAFVAFGAAAQAQDIVYEPVNPSFGGNPFNSAHLLGIANAQNDFKDSRSNGAGSRADIFEWSRIRLVSVGFVP